MNKLVCLVVTCFAVTPVWAQSESTEPQELYPDYRAIGELAPQQIVAYLEEIGDQEAAADLLLSVHLSQAGEVEGVVTLFGRRSRDLAPWEHTEVQLGFLKAGGKYPRTIQLARDVEPDGNLKKIDVLLDKLRVYDYPGKGKHQVLLTFKASNEIQKGEEIGQEDAVFNQSYQAQEGQGAGVIGYPIFLNLNVGSRGAAFQGVTINVSNDDDEKKLSFLESGPATKGLDLLTTAQPALKPLVNIGLNIGKIFLGRHKNKKVFEFFVGLDFEEGAPSGARLAKGSYVVVQAPDEVFRWSDWEQNADGRIVSKNAEVTIPFNYIIFRVREAKSP